jgi:hypothetical protein
MASGEIDASSLERVRVDSALEHALIPKLIAINPTSKNLSFRSMTTPYMGRKESVKYTLGAKK